MTILKYNNPAFLLCSLRATRSSSLIFNDYYNNINNPPIEVGIHIHLLYSTKLS